MREDAIADAAFHDPWVRTPSQILITEHIIKKTDYMSTWYEYMTCPLYQRVCAVLLEKLLDYLPANKETPPMQKEFHATILDHTY